MSEVSIIIRTKDEESWISACLNSVFNQRFKDFEVIIVDNGSTDKTIEKTKQFNVKIIDNPGEYKPGSALNLGIRASSGKYIVCLSGHCIPVNDQWLENAICNIRYPNTAGVYGRQEPLSFSSVFDKRDLFITFGLDKKIQTKDSFFHNANSIIKKSVWEKIPFNEQVVNIEDIIWAKEVLKQGYKIVYEPKFSVYHYHGIHQNADLERCMQIVDILEEIEPSNQTIENNQLKKVERNKHQKTKHQNIIAIIPARGGSKELPRKNICLLKGKPLIAYTIEAAKQCNLVDRIIVSTDDTEIAEIAKKYGAEVPFKRPKELATDIATVESVLLHAVDQLENNNYNIDIVVYLQITDIFRQRHFINQVIKWLLEDKKLETAFVGYPTHKKFWIERNDKFVRLSKRKYITRQEEKRFFIREDTGLACATRIQVIRRGERVGNPVKILLNDDPNSGIDIHNQESLELAEWILKKEEKTNFNKYYY